MIEGHDELWQELSEMADSYAEIGRRLVHAGREVIAPGIVPDRELLEQVAGLRIGFESLRERTYTTASRLDLVLPSLEAVRSLKELAILLEAVIEAQIQVTERKNIEIGATTWLEHDGLGSCTQPESVPESSLPIDEPPADSEESIEPLTSAEEPIPLPLAAETIDCESSAIVVVEEPEPAFATMTSDALLTSIVAEALPFIPYRQTIPLRTQRPTLGPRTAPSSGWKVWSRFNFSAGDR